MTKTLIVVDNDLLNIPESPVKVISFERYLRDYPKLKDPKTRIINLCDIAHYLSKGYYCSLLAEARKHKVLPSVSTINELRNLSADSKEVLAINGALKGIDRPLAGGEIMVYFGQVEEPGLRQLAAKVFAQYPAPLLKLNISEQGELLGIARESFAALDDAQKQVFMQHLAHFSRTVWRIKSRKKRYRWDMAILVDPQEKVPPSNREAIARFVKAAAKNGIQAEVLSADQISSIDSFDALFIRQTTSIDHYTYRLASEAEQKGLVVMDDPQSILRCCNKVFLHDAFSYQQVPSLRTRVIDSHSEASLQEIEETFSYPLVLKMPEGSFSKGVYKVGDRTELRDKLQSLFEQSALVLAQEYLYTDFDWRIGILNGRAVYACKYLMARNHWQIYNHEAKRFFSGDFATLGTFEVPKVVLEAALKAARTIGSGLYGVDVKEVDGMAYVLEVNDNPSIDHRVEDAYLGDELYMQIMSEFQRRLELRGR